MFKFDEYPEIMKANREYKRLLRICNKEEKRIRPDDEDSKTPALKALDDLGAYSENIYAFIIYNTFKDKKPKLYHQFKDYFAKWEEVFPDKWEKFDEGLKNELLNLVFELGFGHYWLPDKYYDDKPIDGCLPAPPTHTKPWGFGCKD